MLKSTLISPPKEDYVILALNDSNRKQIVRNVRKWEGYNKISYNLDNVKVLFIRRETKIISTSSLFSLEEVLTMGSHTEFKLLTYVSHLKPLTLRIINE